MAQRPATVSVNVSTLSNAFAVAIQQATIPTIGTQSTLPPTNHQANNALQVVAEGEYCVWSGNGFMYTIGSHANYDN